MNSSKRRSRPQRSNSPSMRLTPRRAEREPTEWRWRRPTCNRYCSMPLRCSRRPRGTTSTSPQRTACSCSTVHPSRTSRSVEAPDDDGLIPFHRPPRRHPRAHRRPVIDAVTDAALRHGRAVGAAQRPARRIRRTDRDAIHRQPPDRGDTGPGELTGRGGHRQRSIPHGDGPYDHRRAGDAARPGGPGHRDHPGP